VNAGRLADIRYGGIDHGGNRVNYLTPSGLRRKIESRRWEPIVGAWA